MWIGVTPTLHQHVGILPKPPPVFAHTGPGANTTFVCGCAESHPFHGLRGMTGPQACPALVDVCAGFVPKYPAFCTHGFCCVG